MPLAGDSPEDRVDEPAGAFLPGLARQIDRIVHRSRGGNAIEVQKLKRGETKDVEDFAIELVDRTLGELRDDRVEGTLPPQRTRRDFSGESAIAFVVEPGANASQGCREVGPATVDGAQHFVCREPRARNHADRSTVAGAILRPLRNSRAVIARFPSG
jgi:hypothetical protein